MAISPRTYRATAASGNVISQTATDANTVFDFPAIKKACNNAIKAMDDGMQTVSSALSKVQIGKEALCVADKDLQPVVDELSEFVKGVSSACGLQGIMDEIISAAEAHHDELQQQFNDEAKSILQTRAASE